jgi:two-component system cell cycle response regulator DivK
VANPVILIVDDDARNRKLLRDVLGFHEYLTFEAQDAENGLALAVEHLPDLILMDIQLPGISGIEALKRLRTDERTRSIPVMAVTASAMNEDRRSILANGFDAYQSKPIDLKAFLKAVRDLLDASRAGSTR